MENLSYIGTQALRALWGLSMTVGIIFAILYIAIKLSEWHGKE